MKEMTQRAIDDSTLRLAAGYDKLFLDKKIEIEFSDKDSETMLAVLKNELKKLPRNPRISKVGADILSRQIYDFMDKIDETNPVEVNRDDFQVLSLAITDYNMEELFDKSPDLMECLAQVARMFMGVEKLRNEQLRKWLIKEFFVQYGDMLTPQS